MSQQTITITVKAPRTFKVRVTKGRTTRETLMRAVTAAQQRITIAARAA
jgi:hypothetical protein